MWTFEHTETTIATRAQLWQHYADPPRWPEWDHETERVTIDAPIAPGVTGTLKPVKGPKTKFRFLEVVPLEGFSDVSRLPLARLTFTHRLRDTPEGTQFTHSATISGPLSPLFGRIIGANIAAGLPDAMRRLAQLAEQTPVPEAV